MISKDDYVKWLYEDTDYTDFVITNFYNDRIRALLDATGLTEDIRSRMDSEYIGP